MELCERCKKRLGTYYNFYYGTITYRYEGNMKITDYTAKGTDSMCICDSCIKNSRKRKALYYLIAAIAFSVLCGLGFTIASIPAIGLLATSIITFIHSGKPLTAYDGEQMTIDMKNRLYRKQGYNGFYTTAEFNTKFRKI